MDFNTALVGSSASILGVLQEVELAGRSDTAVLVTGENGIGKALIARGIHQRSRRRNASFCAIDCTDVAESVFETKLFGGVRDKVTGDPRIARRLLECANGGTLVMANVEGLSSGSQRAVRHLFEVQCVNDHPADPAVDVRVIATAHEGLFERVRADQFTEALYYYLNIVHVHVPPLRKRPEDIPALVHHILRYQAKARKRPIPDVSPAAMDRLVAYDWPGNVRQVVRVVAQLVSRETISVHSDHLPTDIFEMPRPATETFA